MPIIDAARLFIRLATNLKKGTINLHSPLEEFVIRKCGDDLAYIDNRKDAKQIYGFDFWSNLSVDQLKNQGIEKRILYSESQQFPDFLFKVKKHGERYIDGSLIELKDSKGGNIASFNSTIPTKYKSLEEIDVINGNNLVSRIAKVMDGELALDERYFKFERRCFYLVRTHKGSKKVKVSIVDGSFFETIPKEHLFYQMFLNVLRAHLKKEKIEISQDTLEKVKKTLSHITDQTIIAKSQIIEGASVRPRLRIMAEVHSEGNPHGKFYPEITESSFNLILQASPQVKKLEKELLTLIPEIEVFSIFHKRNGEHRVFQL
ncbi:hypothetical protein DRO69_09860 [Candidatus Bathyarchaeota archaeon]|nr:MAG: hypothetical protein DRO69_09860 [Candidatus Bathyarchaeota archaeon]